MHAYIILSVPSYVQIILNLACQIFFPPGSCSRESTSCGGDCCQKGIDGRLKFLSATKGKAFVRSMNQPEVCAQIKRSQVAMAAAGERELKP